MVCIGEVSCHWPRYVVVIVFVPSGGKTSDALDQALTFPSSRYLDNGTFEVYGWFTPHFFKWHDITTKTYLSHESLENPCIHQQVWFYLEKCRLFLPAYLVRPVRKTYSQLSHEKNHRMCSIESWLFTRDSSVMVFEIFPTNLGCIIPFMIKHPVKKH